MKNFGSTIKIIFYYIIPFVFIASYLFTAVKETQYGLNRDYAEGTTLAFVEKWRTSESPRVLYSSENFEQGSITGYPFAHLGLVTAVSHDAGSALSSGRIISVVSALLMALIAWLILANFELVKLQHLPLLATLILYQTAIFDWSLLARSDLLAALFEILGILFYVRSLKTNRVLLVPSLICFLLAFFCKQNSIAGLLVVFAFEFWRAPTRTLKSAPIYLLTTAAVFGIVTWTFGVSYWEHTVTQLGGQSWYFSRLVQMLSSYLVSHLYIFILSLLALFLVPIKKPLKNFLIAWVAIGFLLVLLGLGRSGSNFNYFISLSIPMGMLAFLSIQNLLNAELALKSIAAISIVAVFMGSAFFENHGLSGRLTYLDHRAWPPTRSDAEKAIENTKSHLTGFSATNLFCDEPGICTLVGFTPDFTYFENNMNTQLGNQKSFDHYDTLLLTEYPSENLTWTKFKLPAGFVKTIHEKYELRRISDLGFIFTRKEL
ncbi:hypothetical protein DOM22_19020 [Bdellovibrio sp. ZAP7]|uniref:hypothetical protein n=1 Tax=Bdellovibrio sp. ZAP7 TaxID=2231053 RepID=UPI001156D346|nr:hypothetical protein [Bdellovibrio sp. ZAP7]QDK47106.1 hypothetical protein DOM22_19020 [Bdellovibrio sp. ZAP7]